MVSDSGGLGWFTVPSRGRRSALQELFISQSQVPPTDLKVNEAAETFKDVQKNFPKFVLNFLVSSP